MIQIQEVNKTFRDEDTHVYALRDIHLTIDKGEAFGVIGESGAGKSTLLRLLNALERPDSGRVLVGDHQVNQLSRKDLRAYQKDVSMVFQQFNLLNNKTVEENVRLPLTLHQYDHPLTVDAVLNFVGLEDKKHSYPSQLSGGQKQRVGIARALISRPTLLLCDEPTSALDQNTTEEIVNVLKKAHEVFGMTIIVVTHELAVIKALCDRSAVMEDGRIVDIVSVQKSAELTDFKSYHERAIEVLTHA
ncbi:methionine ABC transporter ATP-binding protein [Alkalibacterium sp. MB6]|uniref:methionine ABC transporter ATP-binding protein n=1 Tax=Alkalibacterium sp. MB6 TaxID=2081965 RepID=UPI00137B6317|nr:ATP-binding cassette domain-containing protein [Alkalibacterium sp. MB6]